uniref:Uncharacterized protein n=1 Tax=Arion vulgaris TaxID=1028688 RepID=A0A0B6YPU6_9EUPU
MRVRKQNRVGQLDSLESTDKHIKVDHHLKRKVSFFSRILFVWQRQNKKRLLEQDVVCVSCMASFIAFDISVVNLLR